MFDDNQITVAAQRVTGINNAAICGRDNCLSLLPAISIPLLPPSEAPKVSITLPSVGQRQVEIGVLVDVLLTVGSVVLAVGTVTGAVTVVAAGLSRQHFVSTLFTRRFRIRNCRLRRNGDGGILCRLDHDSLLCCVGLGNGISASDWRTGSITHLQGLTNVQRVWCLNIVALSKVTEIVASNPGDIKSVSPFFTVLVLPL